MKNIGLLVSVMFLYGCSDGAVIIVQNSSYENFPEYTIGQAFSNRKVCKNIDWTSHKDDRGATVVQYKCSMAGVDDYVSTLVKRRVKSKNLEHAHAVTSIENDISSFQRGIAAAEKSVTRMDKEIGSWTALMESNSVNWFVENIQRLESQVSLLQRSNADDISQRDAERLGLRFKPDLYSRFKDALAQAKERDDKDAIGYSSSIMQEMREDFDSQKKQTLSLLSSDLDSEKLRFDKYISNAKQQEIAQRDRTIELIKELRQKLEKALSEKDSKIAESKRGIDADIKKFKFDNDLNNVYEFVRWNIIDDSPVFVDAWLELDYRNKEKKLINYGKNGDFLKLIYKNEIVNYAEYRDNLEALVWVRFLYQ